MKTFTYAPKGRPPFPAYLFLTALMLASPFWGRGASPLWGQEAPPRALTLDQALERLGGALAGQLPRGSVAAILNIEAPGVKLSDYVIDELTSRITGNGGVSVVERQNIRTLQGELQFQMSGDVSDETARRIGHMTGAEIIISGGVSQIGNEYRVSVRAINVETALVVFQPQAITVRLDARLAGLLGIEYEEFPGEKRISAGFLNLAGGLGSYLMGDWAGGLIITAGLGAAAGLLVWDLSLAREDPLAGIPGGIGFGVAAVTIGFGFLRPFLYRKSESNSFALNVLAPINVRVVPASDNSGVKAVQLLYTRQF